MAITQALFTNCVTWLYMPPSSTPIQLGLRKDKLERGSISPPLLWATHANTLKCYMSTNICFVRDIRCGEPSFNQTPPRVLWVICDGVVEEKRPLGKPHIFCCCLTTNAPPRAQWSSFISDFFFELQKCSFFSVFCPPPLLVSDHQKKYFFFIYLDENFQIFLSFL